MTSDVFDIKIKAEVYGKRDVDGLNDSLDDTSTAAKGAGEKVGGMGQQFKNLIAGGALIAGAKALFDFGKASLETASNVQEMQSKFNTVFKDLAGPVTDELGTFAEAANRSKTDLMGFAATLQDTFVPLGFARDEAANMSVELVKLAEDLASFNNVDSATVVQDLQSALVGNTETLRKYGVVAQETQIKAEALAAGLWDGVGPLDAQAKAQAILNLTIKGTTDAQGDAIATSGSYENVTKGLAAATTDLKVAIGQGLIPVMTDATKRTTEYVSEVTTLINIKNDLKYAEQQGLITQEKFISLQLKAALSSKDLAEVSEDVYIELNKMWQEEEKAAHAAQVHAEELAGLEAQYIRQQQALEDNIVALEGAAAADQLLNNYFMDSKSIVTELGGGFDGLVGYLDLAAIREDALRQRTLEADAEMRKQGKEVVPDLITSFGYMVLKFGEAEARILAMNQGLDRLDGRHVQVDVEVRTTGNLPDIGQGGTPDKPDKPTQTNETFASGGSFMVPAGYPNDSYSIGVSSGEYVNVSPADRGRGAGGITINVYGAGRSGVQIGQQVASQVTDALGRMN